MILEAISKKVFSADIFVEPSYQVLNILVHACGLILGLALISTENPNFEIASKFENLAPEHCMILATTNPHNKHQISICQAHHPLKKKSSLPIGRP